jgi:uncharacterized protein
VGFDGPRPERDEGEKLHGLATNVIGSPEPKEEPMSDKILFNCVHGKEDPERATLPFVAANVATAAGQKAVVVCTIDAVWLGTPGGTDGVRAQGLPPLADLYQEFVDAGGEVWLCSSCTKPRGIDESKCAKGASIVGAAVVIEEVVNGAKAISFA